jgi:vitamin B12 transporter
MKPFEGGPLRPPLPSAHRLKKTFLSGLLGTALLMRVFAAEGPAGANGGEIGEDLPWDDILLMEGEGLTIVSTPEKTQQIRTISKAEIDKLNPQDLPSLLEQAFGLSVNRNGPYGNTSGVSIRGFGSGRVAVLVDGVPVNSPQSGEFDIERIPVGSIEKIEVVYGGSDTKYNVSGAIGGVVNIVTVKNHTPGFKIGGEISNLSHFPGSYYVGGEERFSKWHDLLDTQNANIYIGLGDEETYWTASWYGNRAFNHFIYKGEDTIKRRRTDNEIWDTGGSTSLSFILPNYSRLVLSGDLYYGDKNIAGPVGSTTPGKQKDLSTRGTVLFDADYVGSEYLDTELTVSHSYNSLDWRDPGSAARQNLHTLTVINRWGYYAGPELSFNAGGDFRYSYLDSSNIGEKHTGDGGIYGTAEYHPTEKSMVIPSLKLVFFKDGVVPVPKLGLVYYPNDEVTIKNNYFRTFKLPAINDLYWAADAFAEGNPDLTPEDGIGGDIVFGFRRKDLLSAESSLYVTYHRDAILWQPAGGKWRPANVGEALYFGSDSRIQSGFSERIILSLSYSFLMTYVLTEDLEFQDDKRMPYKPVHTFGLGIEVPWKTGSLLITQHYESERYTTILNVGELRPYFTLDLVLNQKIGKVYTLFAALRNLFGASYYSIDGYPMPGTTLTAGLKAAYEK